MAEKTEIVNGQLHVPTHPVIPFIEGDGIGKDISGPSQLVINAAVSKAYGSEREIIWKEVLAGEKALKQTGNYLPKETIEAFKGWITSYKLVPTTKIEHEKALKDGYVSTLQWYDSGSKGFELFYKKKSYFRLLDYVNRLYDDQTHINVVVKLLREVIKEWIENGHSSINDQMERAATDFLDKVENEIKEYVIFLPIDGLEVVETEVKIANSYLCRNDQNSEFSKSIERITNSLDDDSGEIAHLQTYKSYFKVLKKGHARKAIEKAEQDAELALNIIRLYYGSFYFDTYNHPSIRSQIALAGEKKKDRIDVIYGLANEPLDSQGLGMNTSFTHYDTFELRGKDVRFLEKYGMDKINALIAKRQDKNNIAGRIFRAITWFGKATMAEKIDDAYLMYAISIESLLSEHRTPKEVYGEYIASLYVKSYEEERIVGGYLSKSFATKLMKTSSKESHFLLIKRRVIELFDRRNLLAHGNINEEDINSIDLLDFEALLRNSIIYFINSGWNNLEDFKTWMHSEFRVILSA